MPEIQYLGKELKNQPTKRSILSALLTMASICAFVVNDSTAGHKLPILPKLSKDISEVNEVESANNTKIDRMIPSHEVEVVAKEPSKSRNQNSLKRQIVKQARADLSKRLSVEVDQIKLLEVREITWPDSSLGCPQPEKDYNQVSQDGLLIRLEVGGRMYFYHSGESQDPFLCEKTSQVVPHPTKVDEFVLPPGSEID